MVDQSSARGDTVAVVAVHHPPRLPPPFILTQSCRTLWATDTVGRCCSQHLCNSTSSGEKAVVVMEMASGSSKQSVCRFFSANLSSRMASLAVGGAGAGVGWSANGYIASAVVMQLLVALSAPALCGIDPENVRLGAEAR